YQLAQLLLLLNPGPTFCCLDSAASKVDARSLHDALPIFGQLVGVVFAARELGAQGFAQRLQGLDHALLRAPGADRGHDAAHVRRSEEHTSELQSRAYLVCRLQLEKTNASP